MQTVHEPITVACPLETAAQASRGIILAAVTLVPKIGVI
jgi:hypothetical protein